MPFKDTIAEPTTTFVYINSIYFMFYCFCISEAVLENKSIQNLQKKVFYMISLPQTQR